jgi:hypothetical protein
MGRPVITVQLVGGLGNQLFGYFAARHFESTLGIDSSYETSKIRGTLNAHGVQIDSLNLPGVFVDHSQSLGKFPFALAEAVYAIAARSPFFSRIVPRRFRSYTSKVIGYDSEFTPKPESLFVRGYFQSWRYSQHLTPDQIQKIDIRNPSEWYTETLAKVREVKPIVIHVRRGDYMNSAEEWGLLGPDYYRPALASLVSMVGSRPVWIFSDDIAAAKLMLADVAPSGSEFVEPPAHTNPAESLLLMTHATGIVIANSTFSWWAARLGKNNGPVIAPSPWFRAIKEPADLLPPQWQRIQSHWTHSGK